MSRTWGMFSSVTSSSVRIAAAMQGSAELLAPETRMVPTSGLPPRMTNLSMETWELLPNQFKSVQRSARVCVPAKARQGGFAVHAEAKELEFQDVIFDGQADVSVGLGQAPNRLRLIDFCFEHDQGHRHTASGTLDGLYGGGPVNLAGAHENSNAAFDEFRILHMDVDHEVLVHIAEPRHCAGGNHVEDHFLRCAGFH